MTEKQILQRFHIFQLREEARYSDAIEAVIRRQVRRVLKYANEHGRGQAIMDLNVLIRPQEMTVILSKLYRQVGIRAANDETGRIREWEQEEKKLWGLNALFGRLMDSFFSLFGAQKVTDIDDTTRVWLQRKLRESTEQLLSHAELSKQLVTSDIPRTRGRLIARTETTGSANHGKMIAGRQSRLTTQKRWLNMHDERVRSLHHDHSGVGGEVRPLDVPFSNGLMYPGDPNGGARQVCNCRCTVAIEPARDKQGRLIRKPG